MQPDLIFTPKIYKLIDNKRFSWGTMDDQIMGGKSESRLVIGETCILFKGYLRNVNNVAWSILRSTDFEQDISQYTGVELHVKGDGRPYSFEIEYNRAWQQEKLCASFKTNLNEWQYIKLPFETFTTACYGKKSFPFNNVDLLQRVLRYNFYAGGELLGPFQLEIDSIKFY